MEEEIMSNNQEHSQHFTLDGFTQSIHQPSPIDSKLLSVLKLSDKIKERMKEPITFLPALIHHNSEPAIFPNSIAIIQGQSGVHKSGIAQSICACLIKSDTIQHSLLGFELSPTARDIGVLYIDTERNLSDQLPYAMQKIVIQAGYSITDIPANFNCISFLKTPRKERLELANTLLNYYTKKHKNHLLVVLDVSTDFLSDFNNVSDSMNLSDMMNQMINEHNVTFICVIHENPGSEKARGHYGTEISNKATTIMQVSECKHNVRPEPTYELKFLKNRNTRRLASMFFEFNEESRNLVQLDKEIVNAIIDSKKHKANVEQVQQVMELLFASVDEISRQDLLQKMSVNLNIGERTAIDRLKEFLHSAITITKEGIPHTLSVEKKHKHDIYFLTIKQ